MKTCKKNLPSDFLKNCKFTNSRYITVFEKVRKQKDDDLNSKQRKLVDKEITLMKGKKEEVIKCIYALNKDAEKINTKAEEKWNFVTKADFFIKTVPDKQEISISLDDSITKMEQSKNGFLFLLLCFVVLIVQDFDL